VKDFKVVSSTIHQESINLTNISEGKEAPTKIVSCYGNQDKEIRDYMYYRKIIRTTTRKPEYAEIRLN